MAKSPIDSLHELEKNMLNGLKTFSQTQYYISHATILKTIQEEPYEGEPTHKQIFIDPAYVNVDDVLNNIFEVPLSANTDTSGS